MAKPNIGLIGATVTAATATPTTLLMSSSISSDGNEEGIIVVSQEEKREEDDKPVKFSWNGTKIPTLEKSSDIKAKYREVDCLKNSYQLWNELNQPARTSSPGENVIYPSYISKGCLVVEYYKQTGTNGKWKGGFRLVWSVSGDSRGMITVFNVNTNGQKLSLDSSVYILDKLFHSSWTVINAQENATWHIGDNNALERYFPKPGSEMKLSGNQTKYWGFDPILENICKGERECSEITEKPAAPTSLAWSWTKNDNKDPITNWSSNFQTWFNDLFSSWFQMKKQLEGLKGTWTKTT